MKTDMLRRNGFGQEAEESVLRQEVSPQWRGFALISSPERKQ